MGICAFHEELISGYVHFSRNFTESAWQVVMLAEQHELQEKIQEFEQGGYPQGRECDHRKARPIHRLAGAPVSTVDRGEDTLYHSPDGTVNR